jgi:hypothetical protein
MSPTSCHCSTPRRPTFPAAPSSIGAAMFHDPVRDGTGWFHRARHTPMAQRGRPLPTDALLELGTPSRRRARRRRRQRREALDYAHGSPARVATRPVSAAQPSHLLGVLPAYSCESIHLEAHFPLRCFQRFLLPDIATEPAGRPTTPPPAVRPARSSRTRASPSQCSKRSERIETELSHDVLNPARVPL